MEIIFKEESYKIIAVCMEVHRILGKGFAEIVYKEAMEYEFKLRNYLYEREKEFRITYKDLILNRSFNADFFLFDKIILEIKAIECLTSSNIKQTLNYLAASKMKLGLLINFGEDSLKFKRIIL